MTKSKARAPGRLMQHLARADNNEIVQVGAYRDLTPTLAEAMEELALRSATVAAKKSWFHAVANPELGQPMSEKAWTSYWETFEHEFALGVQPFIEVQHRKHDRDHRHRVYSLVREDGRLVPVNNNFRRNEAVSRCGELAAGHPCHPGKHHRWVVAELARRGVELPVSSHERKISSAPLFTQSEHQQASRTLGNDPRLFKAQIYDHYVQSGGNWRAFAARLDRDRITVARGDRALLIIDERSRFQLPLARLLREEAKRGGRPIRIRSIDLEAVFSRAKPLREERIEINRRRRSRDPEKKPKPSRALDATLSIAHPFAQTMAAAVAAILAREKQRADRLKRNRERRAALKRGDLDARLVGIGDELCVIAAAEVIRHLRSRRTMLLIIALLAAGSAIAPVLLATAAVALLRRGELKADRIRFRADVDAIP